MSALANLVFSSNSGAIISPDGLFRPVLWRRVGTGNLVAHLCGLNPSTADAENNDPTIRREIAFVQSWGCGILVKTNAYDFRATQPNDLFNAVQTISDDHARWFCEAIDLAADGFNVACWGANCESARHRHLKTFARWRCFGVTKDGFPRHPLYLKATTQLVDLP